MQTTVSVKKNQMAVTTPGNENPVMVMPKIEALEKFMARLNSEPDQSDTRINKMANNSKYMPIGIATMKLDEIFLGLWNFEMVREQVIANEIIGVGILEVWHPVANVWIRRSGSAAVMIQQVSKDKGGTGRISNIDDKIKNTLVKDFPHLETECLKSAAKKLGKIMGRDLNREFDDNYTPIYTETINNEKNLADAVAEMKKANTLDGFKAIWDTFASLQGNEEFRKNYMYYQRKNVKKK